MKKALFFTLSVAIFAVGCASTNTTESTNTAQTLTLEQALQKSAETRQKLLDAKKSYENAKNAAALAAGTKTASDVAKEALQEKVDSAKQQIEAEKEAWKELLGK